MTNPTTAICPSNGLLVTTSSVGTGVRSSTAQYFSQAGTAGRCNVKTRRGMRRA